MPEPTSQPTTPTGQVILKPLPPEDWPSIDHIVTEDGAPVDNVFSEKQMRLLTEPLYTSWKPGRPFVALANVGLFYGVNLPPLVPDTLLSVDVRMPENLFPKLNRSYFVWKYGKPPEVVIEIVSNREGGEDTSKLKRYADIRISNYVIFDPEHHLSQFDVRLFRLNGSVLVADSSGEFTFSDLGLGLALWQGRFEDTDASWLRWTDADGNLIATGAEKAAFESQRADSESQRADSESQRADSETQRAAAAEQRAAETDQQNAEIVQKNAALLRLLQEHGIAPPPLD